MDSRVYIKENNEFKTIADSFNKMARDLKIFNDKVTQMSKMAAVGELAGGVAHEINNPLTGVLGQAQRILKKLPEDNDIYGIIKKIERAAIRCRDIVSDLLDFSRQSEFSLQECSINGIVEDAFGFWKT